MRFNHHTVSRSRRGVGGIIAGVILAAVILTTVLVFFITILNNEKARTGYELQAQQENRDKEAEGYSVIFTDEAVVGGNIDITISNAGPIAMVASRSLVYCFAGPTCTTPSVPIEIKTLSTVLNPNEQFTTTVGNGMLTEENSYRVDVISERGNILNSPICEVEGSICVTQEEPPVIPPEFKSQTLKGIIQGTGSLQLDFKAFGAIFPQLGNRAGINQTGALVHVASPYGSATGYPAFDVPQGLNTVLVEKARNLDPSTQDLEMNRNTGLVVNVGKTTSGQPDPNYLCKNSIDGSGTLHLSPYNEGANKITIPYTDPILPDTIGWVELFFCSTQPATNDNPWTPDAKFNNINGIFMVARGTFENVWAEYAQTIPYQSVAVGKQGITQLNACLYEDQGDSAPCPSPLTSSSVAELKYSADAATLEGGLTVYLHINTASPKDPTPPFNVSWLYPDGNYTRLVTDGTFIPGTRNVAVDLPTGDAKAANGDGDIGDECSKYADAAGHVHYTLIVTDTYDTNSNKNVYYMTFRMVCP